MHNFFIKRCSLALLGILFFSFQNLHATDFVVIDNGPSGTYSSIGAAILAASNGDRIVITNKPGALPWVETLSINKSLTLVSATDNVRFLLQGNVYISPGAGREVTIIGLECLGGAVKATSNNNGTRAKVTILSSVFNYAGDAIDFDFDNFELTVANCDLGGGGDIKFRFGQILGNNVSVINKRGSVTNTSATTKIIGNKCHQIRGVSPYSALLISNNFVKMNNQTSSGRGIWFDNWQNTSHTIENNTISLYGSTYGIYIANLPVGGTLNISNNVITQPYSSSSDYGGYGTGNSGAIITEYNYIENNIYYAFRNITNSGLLVYNSSINIDSDGRNVTASDAINGANPAIRYYDLNLTRGDAGAYGGSYTLDNYFPLTTGSSRVYHIISERGVFQGSNLDVKALGFDR